MTFTYTKLDDHFQVVVKLVVLGEEEVSVITLSATACYFLLAEAAQRGKNTLHYHPTDLITCKLRGEELNLHSPSITSGSLL